MLRMLAAERRFSVLLAGNLLARIGDGVYEFVFIIAVLQATGNGVIDAGVVYFFRFIPYLVLGPVGGALADRLSRQALMVTADVARMIVIASLCALLIAGQAGVVSLALVGMLMTAWRTIFQPAFQAALPTLVAPGHLPAANGATQVAGEIGGMAGPALGALALAAGLDGGQVLLLNVLAYAVSAACIGLIRIPRPAAADTAGAPVLSLRSLYGDFGLNLRAVAGRSQLRVTIAYSSACILFVGAALRILIPAMLKDGGYSDSMVGYAMSTIALGTIIGAVLCARIAQDFSTRRLMLYWCAYGLMMALLPLGLASAATVLAGCFALGLVGAFVDVVLPTNIQRLSTDQNIGKNFSLFSTLANTGEALSGALAGLIVLATSVVGGVTVIGLAVAAVACAGQARCGGPHD
jgi:MFS transporter, DHA3 family, macrolide efflux protein